MNLQSTPAAFAVLDILGYGELMRKQPSEVSPLVIELIQSSLRNQHIQHDLDRFAHFSGAKSAPVIEYLQFSDTLLIWLKTDPPALELPQGQAVLTISYAASLTLASFISAGIPLRGAVGFGPVFVSKDPIFFTGRELYETMKLERDQTWAGAVLHRSAVSVLKSGEIEPFFLNYSVPLRESGLRKDMHAIDWVSPLGNSSELIPPWGQMFHSDNPDVRVKHDETFQFFNKITSMKRQVPISLDEKHVIKMRTDFAQLLK